MLKPIIVKFGHVLELSSAPGLYNGSKVPTGGEPGMRRNVEVESVWHTRPTSARATRGNNTNVTVPPMGRSSCLHMLHCGLCGYEVIRGSFLWMA